MKIYLVKIGYFAHFLMQHSRKKKHKPMLYIFSIRRLLIKFFFEGRNFQYSFMTESIKTENTYIFHVLFIHGLLRLKKKVDYFIVFQTKFFFISNFFKKNENGTKKLSKIHYIEVF